MSLIDRQAAIDELKKYIAVNRNPNHDARIWEEGMNCAVTVVGALPSAKPKFAKDINVPSNDCISRQAAIDAADRADYTGLAIEDVKKVTDEVVKELKKLPSAQPEIIRCKDCKWCIERYDSLDGTPYWMCKNWDGQTDADGFCYEAKRREDGVDC